MQTHTSTYHIRTATPADADRISQLILYSIDQLEDKSYTPDQLRAWRAISSPIGIRKNLQERILFCAFEGEAIVGTIGLISNEIAGLYVSPDKKKSGIGGMLMAHTEAYARSQQMSEIKLTAIPSAVPFYQKKGYKIVKDVITLLLGVEYPEKDMVKSLISSDS